MFKVDIKKDNIVTNSAKFKTEIECLNWVEENKFKTQPRKIRRLEAIKLGLDIKGLEPIIEVETVAGISVEVIYFMFPSLEEMVVENNETEDSKALRTQESREAILLVEELKIQIRTLNKEKLGLSVWSKEVFLDFISSPDIAAIERSLNQASLGTYLSLLPKAEKFYTKEEILGIAVQVTDHINKWQQLGVF